jgi:hypothetical protein
MPNERPNGKFNSVNQQQKGPFPELKPWRTSVPQFRIHLRVPDEAARWIGVERNGKQA